jgi:biotin-dependent carboxylase-like uncharacterized protein
MVQDLGRRGVAALGVPRGGAADPFALRAANRLVGNEDGAACIEATARGPALRFGCDAHVAVVGPAEVALDGRPVPADAVVPVAAGQALSVGKILGDLRCYLAVSGGIDIPPLLGSRASDTLSGLGYGPLRRGDGLRLGAPGRPRGRLVRSWPAAASSPSRLAGADTPASRVLRVVMGPDDPGGDAARRLVESAWVVGTDSDRVGVRLQGQAPLPAPGPPVASRGMVTGAVQVPPDGAPVVLSCDHATVGGYPVVACVISADMAGLGQCRAGDQIRFEGVDPAAARAARAAAERALDHMVTGWFPVRSG